MIVIFSTVVLNNGVLIYLCYFKNICSIEIYIIWILLLFFNLMNGSLLVVWLDFFQFFYSSENSLSGIITAINLPLFFQFFYVQIITKKVTNLKGNWLLLFY